MLAPVWVTTQPVARAEAVNVRDNVIVPEHVSAGSLSW
jgi:hypothetical protein